MRGPGLHVPMFPPPWQLRDKKLTLACADVSTPGRLVTEHGEVFTYTNLAGFLALLFDHDLMLFVDSVVNFHLYGSIRALPKMLVSCTKEGQPIQLRIKQGRSTRTVTSSGLTWSRLATVQTLIEIRAAHDHLGVPLCNTSAAMGQATMRKWWDRRSPAQSRPHMGAMAFVRKWLLGGRVDTIIPPSMRLASAWEIDLRNAYLSKTGKLPAGTAVWIPRRPDDAPVTHLPGMTTGLFECRVTIWEPIPLGVFGTSKGPGHVNRYPTQPGDYTAGLWWEEITILRALRTAQGRQVATVEVVEGWYWREWTKGLGRWARKMAKLRETAPEAIAPLIKQSIVAAIGRFGSEAVRYNLTDTPAPDDTPIIDVDAGHLAAWVHGEPADRGELQIHWASYIMTMVRLQLFLAADSYAARHQLIATNYDALYVTVKPSFRGRRWKVTELHNVTVPAPRHIVSDEKVRRPGIPLDGRAPPA